MLTCHLLTPFPPFCVRDPNSGNQASLSTSARYVRLGSVTLLSAACISHHAGVHALVQSLLLVVSAAVLVLAFVSVVQWRSASRWRPSLPLFLFVGGVLKPSLRTSSLSLVVRVCFAGRVTTVVKCSCWLGFVHLLATLLPKSSIGQLYVFRVCWASPRCVDLAQHCLGHSDQSPLRRRPLLERQSSRLERLSRVIASPCTPVPRPSCADPHLHNRLLQYWCKNAFDSSGVPSVSCEPCPPLLSTHAGTAALSPRASSLTQQSPLGLELCHLRAVLRFRLDRLLEHNRRNWAQVRLEDRSNHRPQLVVMQRSDLCQQDQQ